MALSRIEGDLFVVGRILAGSITLPADAVTDASIIAAANIAASKVERRIAKTYAQTFTDDVVADRKIIHRVYGATATIVGFVAGITTVFGAASTCIVDLLKNGSSILSATIQLSNSYTAFQLVSPAGYTSTSLAAGDVLEVQVKTISGSNLGKGLFADLVIDERAQ